MIRLASDTTPLGKRHLVEAVLGGATLVVAWIIVAATETIPTVEESVFRSINGLPDWVEYVGWPAMQLGAALAIPFLAIAAGRAFQSRRIAIEVAIAGSVAWIGARIIKELAGRERPGEILADIELRPLWEGLGFPSGHVAVAAAIAAVISVWGRGRWIFALWLIPPVVGFMRIYTGAHFPLDVVAGWGLGLLIGSAVAWLGRRQATRDQSPRTRA
jgi:undecaprenyl-diphosphatase